MQQGRHTSGSIMSSGGHQVSGDLVDCIPCNFPPGLVTPTESGSVEIRGFMGDYTIQVRRGPEVMAELVISLAEDTEVTCAYQAGALSCA